ncbi:DUF397 domain-containing protein [Streptomyces sp. NPDC004610]|uniref:DUF397 domain-containing protein n=1 Tax=unclassified Streptomyces TaxID=2593676 RepID=UPI0033AD2FF0
MSNPPDHTAVRWVKSSYSGNGGGSCVEWAPDIATASGLVPVRDSKAPHRPGLTITGTAWSAFISRL